MITKRHKLVVSFAVCALAVATLGIAQKRVERPFKIDGNLTVTFNLSTGDGTGVDWGEATHVGRYDNTMTLHINLKTGVITGSGVLTAANGDQLFWGRVDHEFIFTGGTGRFENAQGQFLITHPTAVVTFPDANTIVATHTYEGIGKITY